MASEEARLLEETTLRVLEDHLGAQSSRPRDGEMPADLWRALYEIGLPLTLVPEDAGGLGIAPGEAWGVLTALGRYGAPAPIADCLLAERLAARFGLVPFGEWPGGEEPPWQDGERLPATYADYAKMLEGGDIKGLFASGDVSPTDEIPYPAPSESIEGPAEDDVPGPVGLVLPLLDGDGLTVEPNHSLQIPEPVRVSGGLEIQNAIGMAFCNGERHLAYLPVHWRRRIVEKNLGPDKIVRFLPDTVYLTSASLAPLDDPDLILRAGAILRSVQIAGALDRVLELTAGYAQERVQFGRPLAKFQAIQQQLAELAAEAGLATAAARTALDSLDDPYALFEVAAAKSQAGEAATRAAAIAHQVHGAIGFTQEYELQHLTRRLWAWREEFGSEAFWQRRLGELVAGQGADALWPQIATG